MLKHLYGGEEYDSSKFTFFVVENRKIKCILPQIFSIARMKSLIERIIYLWSWKGVYSKL